MKPPIFLPTTSFLLLICLTQLSAQTELQCKTVNLPEDALHWASTFVSVPDPDTPGLILIVDPSTKTRVQINTKTGKIERRTDGETITATRAGSWIVFEQVGGTLEAVDTKLHPFAVGDRLSATSPGSIYSGWTSDGEYFLGFGSIRGVRGQIESLNPRDVRRNFSLGFIFGEVSLDPLKLHSTHLLKPVEENSYYLLGSQYFASNLDGFFVADMTEDGKGSIWMVPKEATRQPHLVKILDAPLGYGNIASLKPTGSGDKTNAVFNNLEHFIGVAGIVASEHTLHVVSREPGILADQVRWKIHTVDTSSEDLSYSEEYQIPSTAPHILLTADSSHIYVLEKMKVESWGNQSIPSMKICTLN